MITTVAGLALVLVVTLAAVGATWQLSAGGGDTGAVDTEPVTTSGGTAPSSPGGVAAGARGTVLRSDAQAIAEQVSVLARMGGLDEVDVDAVLADYPRQAGGTTIEASAPRWRVDRTIVVSTGGVSLCVRFDDTGASTTAECG